MIIIALVDGMLNSLYTGAPLQDDLQYNSLMNDAPLRVKYQGSDALQSKVYTTGAFIFCQAMLYNFRQCTCLFCFHPT